MEIEWTGIPLSPGRQSGTDGSLPSIRVRRARSNRCSGWRPGRRSWTTTRGWTTCKPEVEALLVNRLSGKHLYYLVPIDQCYRLSGLIRLHWRGLSGGSEVWEEVGRYFDRLKEKSCSI